MFDQDVRSNLPAAGPARDLQTQDSTMQPPADRALFRYRNRRGPDAGSLILLKFAHLCGEAPVLADSTGMAGGSGMRAPSNPLLTLLSLSVYGALAGGTAPALAAPVMAPISAQGNPAYAIDSQGFVVRGSQGECWRTSSWTPALANVVGCDGVLAKAVPVPSPAPSPRPAAPPAAPDTVPPSAAAPDAARTAPPVVVPPPAPPAEAGLGPDGGAATTARSDKITLDTDTYFDFDQSRLKPAGEEKLKAIAQRLATMDLEVVVATGHTDWTGTGAYNQSLSERRAAAVKRYLVAQGLPERRIFTEGKGEREPVASNQSRDGRAKNRRVVVEVVGKRNR